MDAKESVDRHRRLIEDYEGGSMQEFGKAVLTSIVSSGVDPSRNQEALRSAEMGSRILAGRLKVAETCWVSSKMLEFASIASQELGPEDIVRRDQLPLEHGMMFFESSFRTVDVRGDEFFLDGVLWTTIGGNVLVYWFVDNALHPLTVEGSDVDLGGCYHLVHFSSYSDGEGLGTSTINPELIRGYLDDPEVLENFESGAYQMTNISHLWWAIVALMGQELVSVGPQPLGRAESKRARRAQLKPLVTVVDLRKRKSVRRESGDSGVAGRTLHFRHLRRGHWRNQPTRDGIRRIYISHMWVGDESLPLLVSSKVNALKR